MTSPVVEINSLVGEMTSTVGKINSTTVTRRNRFLVVIKQPVPPLKKVQARAVALAVTVLSRNGPYLVHIWYTLMSTFGVLNEAAKGIWDR